jgi:hypothetical protein
MYQTWHAAVLEGVIPIFQMKQSINALPRDLLGYVNWLPICSCPRSLRQVTEMDSDGVGDRELAEPIAKVPLLRQVDAEIGVDVTQMDCGPFWVHKIQHLCNFVEDGQTNHSVGRPHVNRVATT